jgi:hypothetical protein
VKKLARDICLSRTYQLSTKRNVTNEIDERNFSRQTVRRMRAEVLLDCITQVTETTNRFAGLPLGGRAVQIPDGRSLNYFLTTFGRAARNTACTCEVKTTPTLSQALHLINGETTTGKIVEGKVVETLLAAKKEPTLVVEELYLRCLGRKPTATEADRIAKRLASAENKTEALEDLFEFNYEVSSKHQRGLHDARETRADLPRHSLRGFGSSRRQDDCAGRDLRR